MCLRRPEQTDIRILYEKHLDSRSHKQFLASQHSVMMDWHRILMLGTGGSLCMLWSIIKIETLVDQPH